MRFHPLSAALIVSGAAALAPAAALAHGGDAPMPSEMPPAAPGDATTAQTLVRELEAKGAKDPETAKVTAEPIKRARSALERARGARVAGDEPHARMLEALALEHAETARELDRAAAAEAVAKAKAKKAYEAQTKAERARALLEETQARRGRAAAELARVEAEAKDAQKGAADAETQRLEAAKKKAARPAAPAPTPKKGRK